MMAKIAKIEHKKRRLVFIAVLTCLVGAAFFTNLDTYAQQSSNSASPSEVADRAEKSFIRSVFHVMWERRAALTRQIIEHIRLALFAMALAVTVGVTTGVLLTRFRRLSTSVLGAASVIQTIPSLALLALMIPLLGIGLIPAVAALFLYALLPIMRNTYTAIDEVDPAIIEVGRGMGMTEWQILSRVQMPLCVPLVMAGIRTSTVICVGIATLCTFIGAGGLGTMIMEGMQTRGSALIFAGVVPAILLALALDGLMALAQKVLTPQGLKVPKVR